MKRTAVDDLRRELRDAAPRQAHAERRNARRVLLIVAVLVLGLTGAAVAAVGGSVLRTAPDSPDDPVITSPMSTTPAVVTPLTRDDLAEIRRQRERQMPAIDARRYFSALPSTKTEAFRTIYESAAGLVAIRATDREVCSRYKRTARSGAASGCAPTAVAKTFGAYVWMGCIKDAPHPQRRIVAGVVPDGVAVVQGKRAGVVRASATVVDNGFVLVTDQPIDTISVGATNRRIGPVTC